MTKLFIDSDIILDLLLKRSEFNSSALLMTELANGSVKGYTTPIVIANIHYVMTKLASKKKSIENLQKLRKMIDILSVDQKIIDEAIASNAVDFKDAIQYITAEKNKIDFLITRNTKDYKQCRIPVLSAAEFLTLKKST